jgi:phosphoglucomutase
MNKSQLDPVVLERARYWATNSCFDEATRREVQGLIDANAHKELTDRFYRDLEFGTGGLRGILAAGSNRMNIYNVRRATHALALWLRATYPGKKELKVGIAYDSRRFSREFAETTASVLAAHGIKSLITRELRPTPMLSFLVRQFHCDAGVCVTASHNPKNYNGYKCYLNFGGQLIPPYDKQIIERYLAASALEDIPSLSFKTALDQELVREIGKELDEPYFTTLETLSLRREGRENFKIVFTPLHGTGGAMLEEAFRRFGFKDVHAVPEQYAPDGTFPTLDYPNPEDPAALKMALDLGRKLKADIVLGTDPDADRLGVAVREGDDFVMLNGNQLGSILLDYYLQATKDAGLWPESPMITKTIVTTDLQNDIARWHGAHCEETLTGFKWICSVTEDYETGRRQPYRQYICGGEESYGFLAGRFVRDKDGLTACAIAAEMCAYFKARKITINDALDELYARHGVYMESLHNMVLPGKDGADAIKAMMVSLRSSPPKEIDGMKVAGVRDFLNQKEYRLVNGKAELAGDLDIPKSDVLQFVLSDGTKVSARPSGTEPKIKFYLSVREEVPTGASREQIRAIRARCEQRVQKLEHAFVALVKP